MAMRFFTAVHTHRQGTTHYLFMMDLPEPGPEYPVNWLPDVRVVVAELDIEFEPHKDESIDLDHHGTVDAIRSIDKDARPPASDEV